MQLSRNEIVLSGAFEKRLPIDGVEQVRAESGRLRFSTAGEDVQLVLGDAAERWAKAIVSPPTLAKKLGISSKTAVKAIGKCENPALESALAVSQRTSNTKPDMIVACIDNSESLFFVIKSTSGQLMWGVPIWLVYSTASDLPFGEAWIREFMRDMGMVAGRVVPVSGNTVAVRYSIRKR